MKSINKQITSQDNLGRRAPCWAGTQACQVRWGMRPDAEGHAQATEKHSAWILKKRGGRRRREQGDWNIESGERGQRWDRMGNECGHPSAKHRHSCSGTHFVYNHLK